MLHGHAGLVTGFGGKTGGGVAGRANEGADLIRVFLSRSALDARGHIDGRRPGDAQSFADIAGIEPAGQHEWQAGIEIFQKPPVERPAETAGAGRFARCLGVEQEAVGDRNVGRRRGNITPHRDRDRLHDRQAEAFFEGGDAGGRLLAVKLQQVRPQGFHHRLEQRIVGIDRERHFLRTVAHARGKRPRRRECKMTRRRREEHEADHIGPGFERDIEGVRGRKAANFNDR